MSFDAGLSLLKKATLAGKGAAWLFLFNDAAAR
jgi:hypothetical protein